MSDLTWIVCACVFNVGVWTGWLTSPLLARAANSQPGSNA